MSHTDGRGANRAAAGAEDRPGGATGGAARCFRCGAGACRNDALKRLKIFALVLLVVAGLADAGVCGYVYVDQRSLIFHPVEKARSTPLEQWTESDEYLGGKREAPTATVAGRFWQGDWSQGEQGSGITRAMEPAVSLYAVEYPDYGHRAGTPSRDSITAAVTKADEAIVAKGDPEIGDMG